MVKLMVRYLLCMTCRMGICQSSDIFVPDTSHPVLAPIMRSARVVRVIDGDTLELVIEYRLGELILDTMFPRTIVRVVRTCRIFGLDAAEKNTVQGVFAKNLLIDRLKQVRVGHLWAFVYAKPDKYGRTLASLYDCKHRPDNTDAIAHKIAGTIHEQWIAKAFPNVGVAFVAYDGGTKTAFMKTLPATTSVHKK
jgi:hypothetical protein